VLFPGGIIGEGYYPRRFGFAAKDDFLWFGDGVGSSLSIRSAAEKLTLLQYSRKSEQVTRTPSYTLL
jgi:hypothetical protein